MRCPVCKANNAEGPECRRCKADLSVLFALEDCRGRALARAADALTRGDAAEALRQATRAHRLRAGDDAGRLLALAHVLAGDHAAAWRWYASLGGEGGE
jgi:hypothetical protein